MSEPVTLEQIKSLLESFKSEFKTELKTEIKSETSETVNIAIGKRLKGYDESLSKKLETLAAPKEEAKPEAEGKASPDDVRKLRRLEEKLAQKEQESREEKAFNKVRSEVSKYVKPELVDTAVKLIRADRLYAPDETGDQVYWGADKLDLKEGLESWINSPEGSVFKVSQETAAPTGAKVPHQAQSFAARPAVVGRSGEPTEAQLQAARQRIFGR